ncbi:Hypothetical protein AJAP_38490 [Amycolatopsis japonica]|uniref:Uncharacterized protein n=1 Tax=Amycolatopsis japonica TaxID=208439 RepID=A0A075V7M0_9PSEU|nr:hypothetical protein [Amycolatopsis japonica]AIG80484.1 Hypothetical protein AJAP_38490 [Amycolatopsis japonica]
MDGTRAAVPGYAAALPVLPEGEVWVAMPYKPAFPGIIPGDETPPGVIEDQTRFPALHNLNNDVEVGLRCRPAVARWIGIHLEPFYSNAEYRFTWRGDILEIHDGGPWGEADGSPPRVIRPGDDGRYEIRDLWYPVAPVAVGELYQRHPDALVTLARDDTPAPVPHMVAYLTDHPGAPSSLRRGIETALAKLATDLDR